MIADVLAQLTEVIGCVQDSPNSILSRNKDDQRNVLTENENSPVKPLTDVTISTTSNMPMQGDKRIKLNFDPKDAPPVTKIVDGTESNLRANKKKAVAFENDSSFSSDEDNDEQKDEESSTTKK
jgi:hypothetical protein